MATDKDRQIIWAVARLHAGAMALVGALVGGFGLLSMTAWLLIKGGAEIGPHLQLLSQYFYGYSVTWPGAFVGLFYGVLVGGVVGWMIGALYNLVAGLRS